MKRKKFELFLDLAIITVLIGAFFPLYLKMQGKGFDPIEGDPLRRGFLLVGYGLAFFLSIRYVKKAIKVVSNNYLYWIFVLLPLFSVFWSDIPALTFRRSVGLLLTSLYAFTLVLRYTDEEIMTILFSSLVVSLTASAFVIILAPQWGTHLYLDDVVWRGIFEQKNTLGINSFLLILSGVWLFQFYPASRIVKWMYGGAIFIALILLFGSRSMTANILVLVLITFWITSRLWFRLQRSHHVLFPMLLFGSILTPLVILENYDQLLKILGRYVTFNSRIVLWQELLPLALQRFWIGYGYSAFWLGWEGPSAEIWKRLNWLPAHAHNGYINLFLNLGALGLVLGMALLGILVLKTFYLYNQRNPLKNLTAYFLISFFLLNITENFFLRSNNIWWLLFSYLSIKSGDIKVKL